MSFDPGTNVPRSKPAIPSVDMGKPAFIHRSSMPTGAMSPVRSMSCVRKGNGATSPSRKSGHRVFLGAAVSRVAKKRGRRVPLVPLVLHKLKTGNKNTKTQERKKKVTGFPLAIHCALNRSPLWDFGTLGGRKGTDRPTKTDSNKRTPHPPETDPPDQVRAEAEAAPCGSAVECPRAGWLGARPAAAELGLWVP